MRAAVWPLLALDALTREPERCHGVVGVDSGVSHITVALDLPHVQLCNFDTAWRTGSVLAGRPVSVFGQPAPGADAGRQAEVAACDYPVVMGPHTFNFAEAAGQADGAALVQHGASGADRAVTGK